MSQCLERRPADGPSLELNCYLSLSLALAGAHLIGRHNQRANRAAPAASDIGHFQQLVRLLIFAYISSLSSSSSPLICKFQSSLQNSCCLSLLDSAKSNETARDGRIKSDGAGHDSSAATTSGHIIINGRSRNVLRKLVWLLLCSNEALPL